MERLSYIINHTEYQKAYREIQDSEKGRIFCLHDTEHFLAVSRIAYIFVLEQQLDVPKDVIYAAGFLHDIGRGKQYTEGIPHEEAGLLIASKILLESPYRTAEREMILSLLESHRRPDSGRLSCLFYRADKLSRDCRNCKARKECYWPEEKKNNRYRY
ncbi:HD domain-containing protein [Anaerostipes sp.]|uniref:HD domain-containing protein n=1 Tax=Anaerostipes sp. TaxID=1872530 RepID=UPI0025C5D803|nr:HD domain-containing protein [Anaerostipes sp.]MBS7007662.1 HD domain-containing protein [Anaerostipes sp.]